MAKKNTKKMYAVRAYCTDCGELLMESSSFGKKDLIKHWDAAVIGAAGIPCKKCDKRIPNFHINLRIVEKTENKEYEPKVIIPKPKVKFE